VPTEHTTPTRLEQDDTVELPTLPRAPTAGGGESRLASTDTWTAVPREQVETREGRHGNATDTTTFAVPILSEAVAAAAVEAELAPIPDEPILPEPLRAERIAMPPPAPQPIHAPMPAIASKPLASAAGTRERGQNSDRAERYLEVLQTLEARRQLFEAMLAEREALISERDRHIAALEREVDPARRQATVESASSAAAAPASTDADDARALAALLKQAHQRSSELEGTITGLHGEREHWQAQCEALQFEQVRLQEALRSLSSEHGALRERAAASAVDAARRVGELETQLRARDDTVTELRGQLGAARDALEQRDALIVRLEADVASSAGALANLHLEARESEVEPTRMLIQAEGSAERVQVLGRRTTIGRTPDNDMRIDADFVSRHHAVVLRHGQRTVLEDLNSTNGTYVNGQRVSRCTLNEGDLVTLGHSDFRFAIKPSLSTAR
jgi:FHA domain